MFLITPKRLLILCGCLILLGGVGFYFYQQQKPTPEPVKIYKATESVPSQNPPVKTDPVEGPPIEGTPIEDTHVEHAHPHNEQSHETDKEETGPETASPTFTDTTGSPQKDDVLSEEAIEKWVTYMLTELEKLDTRFMEKYPELFEIANMTQAEFFEKYPTPEEQQELLAYVQRVQPEMFEEIREVFSMLPIEFVDDILLEAKDHFVKMWGQEAADHVMSQLRTELGL